MWGRGRQACGTSGLSATEDWWRGLWVTGMSPHVGLGFLVPLLFWAEFPRSLTGRGSPGWPQVMGKEAAFLMALPCHCACGRTIKVPDHPEALCFQIRGAAPPYVFAVGRGEQEPC